MPLKHHLPAQHPDASLELDAEVKVVAVFKHGQPQPLSHPRSFRQSTRSAIKKTVRSSKASSFLEHLPVASGSE